MIKDCNKINFWGKLDDTRDSTLYLVFEMTLKIIQNLLYNKLIFRITYIS